MANVLRFEKVAALPGTLSPSTMYFVQSADAGFVEIYLSDSAGTASLRTVVPADVASQITTALAAPLAANLDLNWHSIVKYTEVGSAAVGSSAGVLALDANTGNLIPINLTENVTSSSIANVPATGVYSLTLEITQGGVGGWTMAWWTGIKWANGTAPVLSSTAGQIDVVTLYTRDGGTSWIGVVGIPAAA